LVLPVYRTGFAGFENRSGSGFVNPALAKGYTQREGIDCNGTFSPVPCKDSFRIIMALVAHYDLELHQMDVKSTFVNGDLYEDVYMTIYMKMST
jgi:hypothetical protein